MTRPGTFDTRGDRATTKRPRYRAPDSATKRSWFQLRVGPGDLARLDALGEALGLSRSAVVRRALERLATDLGLSSPDPDHGPPPERLE